MELLTIGTIAYYVVQLAIILYGMFQHIRAGRLSQAMAAREKALATIVAALELAPNSARRDEIKLRIQRLADTNGAEAETIAQLVQDVCQLLEENNLYSTDQSIAHLNRVNKAVEIARARRAMRK